VETIKRKPELRVAVWQQGQGSMCAGRGLNHGL